MEFIFNSPLMASPLHKNEKGKKRTSFSFEEVPLSSPGRETSKPRLSLDGFTRQVPGWATPPKSPKSPKALYVTPGSTTNNSNSPSKRNSGVKNFGFPNILTNEFHMEDSNNSNSNSNSNSDIANNHNYKSNPTSPVGHSGRSKFSNTSSKYASTPFPGSKAGTGTGTPSSIGNSKTISTTDFDRFIPNRDHVDFDMAGHILQASIIDENVFHITNKAIISGSNGSNGNGAIDGIDVNIDTNTMNSNSISSSSNSTTNPNPNNLIINTTSNIRTHLGVISNNITGSGSSNNGNCNGGSRGLLGIGNKSSSSNYRDSPFLIDDGFSCLKNDKVTNNESCNNDVVTGVAATAAVRAGYGLSGGGISGLTSSSTNSKNKCRYISSQPSRILDAPELMDDYYLNLLSWGTNNVIAVALNQSVYLWHASDGHIDNIINLENDEYITSVSWNPTSINSNTLAVGTSANKIEIWDTEKLSMIRDMDGHSNRVSSLAWNGNNNPYLLSSGGRDGCVINHDTRASSTSSSSNINEVLHGHTQEVCGLAWSPDGLTLASGGNENRLCLWDSAMSSSRSQQRTNRGLSNNDSLPRYTIEQHNAAVKAVSWCPWQRNVLASGGGTADRTIRLWNASNGTNLRTVDTGSQVCAIQWSLTEKEVVSSHGFSDNQIILWKYGTRNSTLTRMREFHGHSSRVLHLARSPDGSTICSASADETIRFWDIFGSSQSPRSVRANGTNGSNGVGIDGAGPRRLSSDGGPGSPSRSGSFGGMHVR